MSKRKDGQHDMSLLPEERSVSIRNRKHLWVVGGVLAVFLVTVGVFAKNEWFPSKRTGWFGSRSVPGASATGWFSSSPLPTPTPQLSKEYVYAGSRLLSVVDANAQEAPPADLAVWRPSTGGWWVMGGQWSQQVTQNWGSSGDDPVEGDYS